MHWWSCVVEKRVFLCNQPQIQVSEMNRATFVHIQAKLGQDNLLRMVRWLRWHCPPDTGFEISSPGGLRPSTLPLGHGDSPQYWLSHVDGEETFFASFKPLRQGTEPWTLAWKAAVLTTTLGPPPYKWVTSVNGGTRGWILFDSATCRNPGPLLALVKFTNSNIYYAICPGGLRPSTLPLGHGGSPQYWLSHVDGEETFFVSFKPPRPGADPWILAWKAAVLTTTLAPPPNKWVTSVNGGTRGSILFDSATCRNPGPPLALVKFTNSNIY